MIEALGFVECPLMAGIFAPRLLGSGAIDAGLVVARLGWAGLAVVGPLPTLMVRPGWALLIGIARGAITRLARLVGPAATSSRAAPLRPTLVPPGPVGRLASTTAVTLAAAWTTGIAAITSATCRSSGTTARVTATTRPSTGGTAGAAGAIIAGRFHATPIRATGARY